MESYPKEIEMYYKAQWKMGYCKWVLTPVLGGKKDRKFYGMDSKRKILTSKC